MNEEEFDLEKFDQEFEQEWNEQNGEAVPEDQVEAHDPLEMEEDAEGLPNPDVDEEPPATIHDPDADKRNQAFAQMRREAEQYRQQAEWLKTLAEENGLTVEELKQQYETQRLNKEAEKQGVPVDVLQRLKTLEEENQAIKQQTFAEKFNQDVNSVIEKHNASEEAIRETFQYIHDNNLKDLIESGAVSFDKVYQLAHLDTIVNSAKEQAVQETLTQKKKRQQEAPLAPNGGTGASEQTLLDMADADAKAILESGSF